MKKIILIMLLLSFVILGNAMSKKNETLPQEKQTKTTSSIEKTMTDIDKEVYMPKKLIYSELPDDYPKELDELFRFYYDVMHKVAKYDHKLTSQYDDMFYTDKATEYLDTFPISKIIHLKYLVWLAGNTIPLYFAEYIAINNQKQIDNFSDDKIKKLSIIPEKFQKGFFFRNHIPLFPRIGKINAYLTARIEKKYPKKLNYFYRYRPEIYLKGKIIEKKYAEKKYDDNIIRPCYYIKLKVLDVVGGEFKQKEVIVRIEIYPYQNSNRATSIVPIEVGREYFMPILPYCGKIEIADNITFDGKLINHNLIFYQNFIALYPLTNDKYKSRYKLYGGLNRYSLGKKEVYYEEIKENIEKEINFLKSNGKIGGSQ